MKWLPGKRGDGTPDLYFIECGTQTICKTYHNNDRTLVKYTLWDGGRFFGVYDTAAQAKKVALIVLGVVR